MGILGVVGKEALWSGGFQITFLLITIVKFQSVISVSASHDNIFNTFCYPAMQYSFSFLGKYKKCIIVTMEMEPATKYNCKLRV